MTFIDAESNRSRITCIMVVAKSHWMRIQNLPNRISCGVKKNRVHTLLALAASNSRDHIMNHENRHCISPCSCHIYIWVWFFTHIPFVMNCTFNATLTESVKHLHQGLGRLQRCAWSGFWIFSNRTPAASNRIRSEVFFPAAGSGLDLDFVFTEKMLLVVCLSYIFPDSNRSRIAWI